MSITGKSSLSIKKQDIANQLSPQFASKKLIFAHKATVGDTGINLQALSVPSEMSTVGFVQPTAAALAAANLMFYKNNLTLVSSARGVLVGDYSYTVNTSSQINFVGFTALANEIFVGIIDKAPSIGLMVVDAQPIVISGTLLAGQTDFVVGSPFTYGKYPSQQVGAVLVFVDGAQQFRNVGNTSVGEGNYYEIPVGDGNCQVIRFNVTDVVNRPVLVVSNGLLAERPSGSMMAIIEQQQGKLDKVIDVLAATSGQPTTYFQSAPSQPDLKSFGDMVYNLAYNAMTIGGVKTFSDTTDSTSTTTGAVIVSGGVGIAKHLYVGMGLNVSSNTLNVDDATSRVGVGIAVPLIKFHVVGGWGAPATSGTTPAGNFAVTSANSYSSIYLGTYDSSPYAIWIQAQQRNDLSVKNILALNPLGGDVGIGINNPQAHFHTRRTSLGLVTVSDCLLSGADRIGTWSKKVANTGATAIDICSVNGSGPDSGWYSLIHVRVFCTNYAGSSYVIAEGVASSTGTSAGSNAIALAMTTIRGTHGVGTLAWSAASGSATLRYTPASNTDSTLIDYEIVQRKDPWITPL